MRTVLALWACLAWAHVAAAEPGEIAQGWDVLAEWMRAQNVGDFAGYSALYDEHFAGVRRSDKRVVRLDRAHWLADRARMFKKPMVVDGDWLSLTRTADGVTIFFEQGFSSGAYKDFGRKRIDLVRVGSALKIAREEQLESSRWEDYGTRPISTTSPSIAARETARALLSTRTDRVEVDSHSWAVGLLQKFDPLVGLRTRDESGGRCTLSFAYTTPPAAETQIGQTCCPAMSCEHATPRASFWLYMALRHDEDVAGLRAFAQRGLRLKLSTDQSTSEKVRRLQPAKIDDALLAELYPLRSMGDHVRDKSGYLQLSCDNDFTNGNSNDEASCEATSVTGFTGHYRFRRADDRVYLIAIDEIMEHGE